jgi:hypothetical protein
MEKEKKLDLILHSLILDTLTLNKQIGIKVAANL